MALPAPGSSISLAQIAAEFGGTVPHSMSEYYRGGAYVTNIPANAAIPISGTISFANFYSSSKRSTLAITISSPTYNYNVYTAASPSPYYSAGLTDVIVTVAATAGIGSTSSASYSMSIPASFNAADTVQIINSGLIIGAGGNGGVGDAAAGSAGGNAINALRPVVITNNSTIAGGGGGGGCGRSYTTVPGPKSPPVAQPGGGSGGGAGFVVGVGGPAPGSTGTPGTESTGGAGGPGSAPGGAGGNAGVAGTAGSPSPAGAGGAGGAAGYYIVGAPYVTWPATGTRLGNAV